MKELYCENKNNYLNCLDIYVKYNFKKLYEIVK